MIFKRVGLGLFILVAAVVILGTFAQTYKDFLKQHYDHPKSSVGNPYCNTMMKKRGMTKPKCKEVNTFIHTKKNNIIAVCTDEGGIAIDDRLQRSKQKYLVTNCRIKGSLTKPCEYSEDTSPRHLVTACEDKLPVHQWWTIYIMGSLSQKDRRRQKVENPSLLRDPIQVILRPEKAKMKQ
ncbi:ribonuclease-like [Pantherophis guttatus]|uniref:Ribonuclease-like n=1 Tax=Pantherophis guttatus TaxID=94885 RepID=A0A6P9BHP2_PANGU|nr:ribonuclease-like [Pantherophis guttatus]XP_060546906.1 ribonuclease-like [Pantherophis guttatus]